MTVIIMNFEKIANAIVKGLHKHTNVTVVPSDTTDRKPEYPYITYKIMSAANHAETFSLIDEPIPSTDPRFEFDVQTTRIEQPYFSLSINTYSDCEIAAYGIANKVRDWFTFHGDSYFAEFNIVVVKAGNISDRAQQIVDDFENRYGFDVRIRAARTISKRIEGIESVNLTNEAENA
jgi:hypothetical protein